jgi:hypothetical protein
MMIKILLVCSALVYLLIAAHFLRVWLQFFKKDTSLSNKEKLRSWAILAIATTFWLIVVPIAYIELLEAKRTHDLS